MTDRPDRPDLDARLALVQAYVDGEADDAGRTALAADPELMAEAAAQHELRVELGRPVAADPAARERSIAAALAAFDSLAVDSRAGEAGAAAPVVTPPPPVSLSARRRARWLMPAAAALAAVAGGAVVAVVATSSDSDSDQATEQVALDAGEPADTATGATAGDGTLRVLAGTATEEAELAATEAISDDTAPAAAEAAGDAAAATTVPTGAAGSEAAAAVPEALPRLETAEDLAIFAVGLVTGDAGAGSTTVAAPAPVAGDVGDCGPEVLAWAELVDGELVRLVAVLIDDAAGDAVALAADTCTEVLRVPMP